MPQDRDLAAPLRRRAVAPITLTMTSPDQLLVTVYSCLQNVARARRTTTYAAVAAAVGLDIANPTARAQLADALDQINRQEHARGRPMLSAVVCFTGGKRPGAGFYRCARALGRDVGRDLRQFWEQEVQAVYQTWGQQPAL